MLGKIDASLSNKLKKAEWGEYRLGDLFDVENKWIYGKNKNWKTRFEREANKRLPVISGVTVNNGISYYTEDIAEYNEIFCDSLTISTRGEYSGTVTYHEGKFVLANNILVMLMPYLNKRQKIFIGAIINNLNYGGYNNYPKINTLKNDKIQLPIKNDKIDLDFMEDFVEELEKKQIDKLFSYLKIKKMDNYILTSKEKQSIKNLNNLEWSAYNLKDLFGESTRGKRLKSEDRIPGNLPFVTAGEANEGVSDFIGNNVQVFSKNTTTIDMFGSAKYRNYEYGGDDHVAIVHTEDLPMNAAIFVTSAIHKASHHGQFNYGRNFYAKDADELYILLPTKNQNPDYNTMTTVISAIQKLVIKDVVLYVKSRYKEIYTYGKKRKISNLKPAKVYDKYKKMNNKKKRDNKESKTLQINDK